MCLHIYISGLSVPKVILGVISVTKYTLEGLSFPKGALVVLSVPRYTLGC